MEWSKKIGVFKNEGKKKAKEIESKRMKRETQETEYKELQINKSK